MGAGTLYAAEIVLTDAGCGICDSLRRNRCALNKSDCEVLSYAFEYGTTRYSDEEIKNLELVQENIGEGLWYVKKMVSEVKGEIIVRTNSLRVKCEPAINVNENDGLIFLPVEPRIDNLANSGTQIRISIPLISPQLDFWRTGIR